MAMHLRGEIELEAYKVPRGTQSIRRQKQSPLTVQLRGFIVGEIIMAGNGTEEFDDTGI